MDFKQVKKVIGHAAYSRLLTEMDDVGYVRRLIREPYRSGPSQGVYEYKGRKVLCCETAHRTHILFEVPADVRIFKTNSEAEKDFLAHPVN